MTSRALDLEVLPWRLAVCRLDPGSEPPAPALAGEFYVVARTPDELSVICMEDSAPDLDEVERGWCCLRVAAKLDFDEIGVLASLAEPLATAKISLFAVSTWDTDYLLVKEDDLEDAVKALGAVGHRILTS